MSWLLVGLGGAGGALARYYLSKKLNAYWGRFFPVGILCVNGIGAFFLGLLLQLAWPQWMQWLLADGFCGAFTTFSTFLFDGFILWRDKKYINGLVYLGATIGLGLACFTLGSIGGQR